MPLYRRGDRRPRGSSTGLARGENGSSASASALASAGFALRGRAVARQDRPRERPFMAHPSAHVWVKPFAGSILPVGPRGDGVRDRGDRPPLRPGRGLPVRRRRPPYVVRRARRRRSTRIRADVRRMLVGQVGSPPRRLACRSFAFVRPLERIPIRSSCSSPTGPDRARYRGVATFVGMPLRSVHSADHESAASRQRCCFPSNVVRRRTSATTATAAGP